MTKKYCIEFGDSKNRNPIFNPLQQKMRGRWAFKNNAGESFHAAMRHLSAVESIPGICLEVDLEKGQMRLFDPLDKPENAAILATLKRVQKSFPNEMPQGGAWPESTKPLTTADQVKDLLYWMRRFVDGGKAFEIGENKLPPLEDIVAMPGRRSVGRFNTAWREDKEKWADAVPVGAAASAGDSSSSSAGQSGGGGSGGSGGGQQNSGRGGNRNS